MKRIALAALLVAGTMLAAALTAAPAQAATCKATDVTVVVKFDDGHTETGCASGDPASGYAALAKAGFPITYATGNGTGAVCRIAGEPSNNNCGSMPPANAYWSYFHAQPGGTWAYSTRGGGSYNPKPGTVEGWCFACGDTWEGTAPQISAPKPTPQPTEKPSKSPTKPATKPTRAQTASATPTVSATATASAAATASPSADATVGTTPTPGSTPTTADAAPTSSKTASDSNDSEEGGGISWIWGLVLLAVLAAAGTVAVRRRG